MKAVILAAGSGSRLREGPKALVKLLGLTLLERTILTAHDAGIDEFIIVVGCSASKIKHFIGLKYPTLKIQWVHNEKWNLQNGYSLWEARQYVYENFVLLMADHVLHPSFLKEFLPVIARLGSSRGNLNIDSEFTQSRSEGTLQPLNDREDAQGDTYAVLAVDQKIFSIIDLPDACKVAFSGSAISSIDKNLSSYQAIDTGVFLCSPKIFGVLEEMIQSQSSSISLIKLMQNLAMKGQLLAYDIGKLQWQDVDTPAMKKAAARLLLSWCRKPTDGIVSKYLNRPISLSLSRFLVMLPLSPTHVTYGVFLIGIASCYFMKEGSFLLGFLLFQGASILDGCDGEVAKLKNKKTKIGAWLDTLSDNIIYVFFLLCMGIGFYEWQSQKFYLYLSMSSLVFLISSLGFMYFYLKDQKEEGSLVWVERSINQLGKSRRIFLSFIPRHLSFVAKRDFFALAFFILALFEMWFPISVCVLIGSAFVFIYSVLLVIHRNKVGKPNRMSYNVNPA